MLLDKYCTTSFSSYDDFYENYHVNVPKDFNFAYDVLDELAIKKPNAHAMVWCNDKGEDHIFTFLELKELSCRCAAMFSSYGIVKGDFVMATLKRHYEYWICALALHRIGAVLIPATHLLKAKDFAYRFTSAHVKVLVTDGEEELLNEIDEACAHHAEVPQLKFVVNGKRDGYIDFHTALKAAPADFPRPTGDKATKSTDKFLMYFTSGTTGMPKMVLHDCSYPLGHIITAKFWQTLAENDLHFTVADTGWGKASWGKFYGQWLCESAFLVYDYDSKFQPTDLLDVIARYKVTVFCAPPTIFRFLIKEDLSKYDLSSLRHCCIAGEPLNPEVFNKWREYTGLSLMEGYGQTEMACVVANFAGVKPRPGSMGKPAPDYCPKVLDENHQETEVGEEGEICIRVAEHQPVGLFMGYYGDQQRMDTIVHDGWYHTGDMAWRDEDGYFWFVGRSDDVIKSSGYRIGPFEVESALIEHPAVLETAITAVPDPVRGQIVKATVVLAKGYAPSDELKKELQDFVKRTTAPYKYPRVIEFVASLPKTISGKIRRVEIRDTDSEES